jgi:putative heme transporter
VDRRQDRRLGLGGMHESSKGPQPPPERTTLPARTVAAVKAAAQTKRYRKSAAQTLAIIAVVVGVAAAVYSQRTTIGQGLHRIGNLNWGWVAAASLIEGLSMMSLALLYRELLRANHARLTLTWIFASCLTANAISVTVPVIGSGMASRRAFRRFCQGGADAAAASLTLTVAGIVSTVTLATVVTAGAVLSGNPAAAGGGLLAAIAMLSAAVAVALGLRSEKGRMRLLRMVTFVIAWSQRVTRHPKGQAEILARAVLTSVQRMRLGWPTLARVLLWGSINWWADVACLAFAMWAAGIGGLSAAKILLVWTAGAGAATLSPTPAGIGVVEVAMVAAMAAVGVKGAHAITAVLVYRIISLKGAGGVWAVAYEYLNRRRPPTPDTSPSPTEPGRNR